MKTLLNISDAAAIGLHCSVMLAQKKRERCGEMAGRFGISAAHVSKVMQRLVKAGIVKSLRGPCGGFELARPPEKIKLGEVFAAIEGKTPKTRCLFGHARCPAERCVIYGFITGLNREFERLLSLTLRQAAEKMYGEK